MIADSSITKIQMTNRSAESAPLVTARVAGLLYLIVAILGGFGFFLGQSLITPGDAGLTAGNVLASESLFRLASVSALVAQTVQIVLVLVLYNLLKPVNKNIAVLMVIFSLVGIPIAMLNLLNQFAALLLLSGAGYLAAFETDQLHSLTMLFLDLQTIGVSIAQIFWGLWLLPLGYLVYKSGFLPGILGILLMIGGFGYLVDSATFFLFPNFDATLSQFTFIGELLLPLWLLIKGVNVEQWQKRALKAA